MADKYLRNLSSGSGSPNCEKTILLAHPSMFQLARKVIDAAKRHQCNEVFEFIEDGVKWRSFKDGFPDLFIENVKNIMNKKVFILASFHNPAVIFEQLSLMYAIPRYLAKSVTIILPYFPTGTMERVDHEGQIATAKTLASLLSAIPLTSCGPAQILLFDIHALQERFYFSEQVIPRLETAVPLLTKEIIQLQKLEPVAIAFPDEGADKRFRPWVESLSSVSVVICTKVRQGAQRVVKIKEGEPGQKHVIIVDDLVQSGGTIIECTKVLLAEGALKVSAFVTHAVFPGGSWKQFITADEPAVKIENFWITDSIPHANEISNSPPFKILSINDLIVDNCLR
ncbi:hypothetical protein HELRODRAFT_184870 [Helobdella robusta]|uniref:Phosphoribosyltransferase domain-containing protein n=1 Tax=Helobdella robusta TaxID=6412 RepID=T1FM38_HELRO|nr:hypothetical protein HELRODRAFT_184870 [Helobdella robusta]ESO13112.1 hypothetical protein HELRODRAFT_184870 [Helobdella robusta]